MKEHLTLSNIRRFKPRQSPYDVHDTKLPGFIVRVYPSGRMSYAMVYKRGKRKTLGSTEALSPIKARELAQTVKSDAIWGIDPQEKARKENMQTFTQFLSNDYGPWVIEHRKSGKATLARLRNQFGWIAKTKLDKINSFQIAKWRTQRLKAGIKPTTLNRDITALKAALNQAVEWKIISSNPIHDIKPLKTENSQRVRFLSPDEISRLKQAITERSDTMRQERDSANLWRAQRHHHLLPCLNDVRFTDHIEPMILLTISTGMRRGEIFSLKWTDVDTTRRTLTVRGDVSKNLKTRHIPLNDTALKALTDWKEQCPESELVFPSENGKPFTNIKNAWRRLLRMAKIDDFRWHDLRHHFASMLVMKGKPLNTVRELLGHSKIEMTIRYAHLCPDHKAEAVAVLDDLFTDVPPIALKSGAVAPINNIHD